MAAMMFPAIAPMVLLYNVIATGRRYKSTQSSVTVQEQPPAKLSVRSLKVALFVGSYLLVWAVTGIALLLGWSVVMNSTIMSHGNSKLLPVIYGSLLIVAGAYQFTPLKRTCIGYCESPMGFFARRWRDGTSGAVRMGLWHGLYCLGCCWSYFLLMVALGWMNLLWMGLFAGVIFGEKMWRRGIWIARAAGLGLAITGVLIAAGIASSIIPSSSMDMRPDNSKGSIDGNQVQNSTGMSSDSKPAVSSAQTLGAPSSQPATLDSMQNTTSDKMPMTMK